jgi:hypothetical protein
MHVSGPKAPLACPFMGSILTVSQIPNMGDSNRIQVHEYAGGHMFYARVRYPPYQGALYALHAQIVISINPIDSMICEWFETDTKTMAENGDSTFANL